MPEQLEALIDSLLFEGYALYPYTPGAMKNSTPTPFGIVYPPRYAAALSSTFDHVELRCVLAAPAHATVAAEVRFLAAGGVRHEADAGRLELVAATGDGASDEASVGALAVAERPLEREAEVETRGEPLRLAIALSARELEGGLYELSLRVENRSACADGLDRAGALARSLLSTHPILTVSDGCFISPLERPCASVNTFPVLAGDADDAVIGATIVLPDHPQIAPESRGGLFDSTEIEEALLLHVKVLSDDEREQIERHDPAVREMVARAAAATPQEILALHGRVTLRDPEDADSAARSRFTDAPPEEPAGLLDPTAGEEHAEVDGVRFRRGGKVRIRPDADADLHARLLDGRAATIERIMVDYDGKVHLGVTIDGDPGQELMRESGRLLFFFAPEVEVLG
ncbi:MAG TPA: hypothetical protein VGN13_11015 [Solirubrobacteraceae bacterium]|jgi:hypothetical protein